MDKIPISDYLGDYTISDKTPVTISNYAVTEYIYLISPSPQLINWLIARGWGAVSWTLTDPSAITDFAYMQKSQLDERRVLQGLVDEFTDSYNEGRTLNDTRYDEILSLLAVALDKTEDGLVSLETDEDTYESLVEAVISALASEYTTHKTAVEDSLDDWGDAQRTRIDNKFADDKSAIREVMIDTGWYNTSNLTTAYSGSTREEAVADNENEDIIKQRILELDERLYAKQVDIRMKFLEARNRLITLLHSQADSRIQLRNRVIEAVSGFAERRNDEYPSFLEPLNATLNVSLSQKSQGWA